MPHLIVAKGKSKGKSADLNPGRELIIGREKKLDLWVQDAQASRRHFKIANRDGRIAVEDLQSLNGTWVNGRRARSAEIKVGDKVRIGETIFFLVADGPEDDEGALTGREICGYKIGRLLGRGGMGVVYKARQLSLDRDVAFKVLARELTEDGVFVVRFLEEARSCGRLNHPNIVQVYDVGIEDDVYYYSLELMERGCVDDLIRERGPLSLAEVLPIAIDASRGLEYAETRGLIHRDIKPENLFLSGEGVAKIGDLGISQFAEVPGQAAEQDSVSGSPKYIAPEQALGKAIDHRADLYALGVSLYEMLAGVVPYTASSPRAIILKHINDPVPDLARARPGLPPPMVRLVADLMAKDPNRRPRSAAELTRRLMSLLEVGGVEPAVIRRLKVDAAAHGNRLSTRRAPTPPPSSPEPPPRPAARSKVGMAAVGALIVLLFVAAGAWLARERAADKRRQAERRQQYQDLEGLLAAGKFFELEDKTSELAARWRDEGHLADASAVELLKERARLERKRRDQERWEQEAARAYEPIAQWIDNLPKLANDGPRLTRLDQELRGFIERYDGSQMTARARRDLLALQDVRDAYFARIQAEKDRVLAIKRAGEALGRQVNLLAADFKFQAAADRVSAFADQNKSVEARGIAGAILDEIERYKQRFKEDSEKGVLLRCGQGQHAEARRQLTALIARVDTPALKAYLRELGQVIDRSERDAEARRLEETRARDARAYATAAVPIRRAVLERRFDEAADAADAVLARVELDETRRAIRERVTLYRRADAALRALVARAQTKKGASKIRMIFIVEGAEQDGVAVEGNRDGLGFEIRPGVILPKRFKDLRPPELLELFDDLDLEGPAALDLACLGWAVGQRRHAAERLERARGAELDDDSRAIAAALARELGS